MFNLLSYIDLLFPIEKVAKAVFSVQKNVGAKPSSLADTVYLDLLEYFYTSLIREIRATD